MSAKFIPQLSWKHCGHWFSETTSYSLQLTDLNWICGLCVDFLFFVRCLFNKLKKIMKCFLLLILEKCFWNKLYLKTWLAKVNISLCVLLKEIHHCIETKFKLWTDKMAWFKVHSKGHFSKNLLLGFFFSLKGALFLFSQIVPISYDILVMPVVIHDNPFAFALVHYYRRALICHLHSCPHLLL